MLYWTFSGSRRVCYDVMMLNDVELARARVCDSNLVRIIRETSAWRAVLSMRAVRNSLYPPSWELITDILHTKAAAAGAVHNNCARSL